MRYLEVFIASSIVEFSRERVQIQAAFNRLNSELVARGAYAAPIRCEDLDNSIRPGGTQAAVIDPRIRECDLFVLLAGETVGRYTLGEVELALSGDTRTLALFRARNPDETVTALRRRLEASPRCVCESFETIDAAMASIEREVHAILDGDG